MVVVPVFVPVVCSFDGVCCVVPCFCFWFVGDNESESRRRECSRISCRKFLYLSSMRQDLFGLFRLVCFPNIFVSVLCFAERDTGVIAVTF